MQPLTRKLQRELWHLKGQMFAVVAVVTCGIAVFVSMSSVKHSLEASRWNYYHRYRFADVFVQVKRAPESLSWMAARMPGVAAVATRIVTDVTIDVPGLDEPATGRLVSIPIRGEPPLNGLHIVAGRTIETDRIDEVVASKPFMEANGLKPGDRVGAVINGRRQELVIVGSALSPEYIYEVQPGSFFPDKRRFGVFWISRRALESALDMDGAFNDLSLTLTQGASEKEVITRLDLLFERYGSLGAYGRSEQLSDRFISDEIKQLGTQITLLPAIFLGVAVFLLNIVLQRLVSTQREQIAVLKAMGYAGAAIGRHYLGFALAPTLTGALFGTVSGAWLGTRLVRIYGDFYNFAELVYVVRPQELLISVLLSVVAAAAGALLALRRVMLLPPAEAMKPEAPPVFRPGMLERSGFGRRFPVPARIMLRNIERRPWKSALSVFMISLSVAILIAGRFTYDAVDRMVAVEFDAKHREDVTVVFTDPMPPSVAHSIASLDGVLEHEYYREEPARLVFGHRSRRQTLKGLPASADLQRLVDAGGRVVELPVSGLMLTRTLADLLGVKPGDRLQVQLLQGSRRTAELPVSGTIDEILGLSAYLPLDELDRLAGDGGAINAACLRIDPSREVSLYRQFKRMPGVSGITLLKALRSSFDELIAESMLTSTLILTLFACILAFAVIYNGARISLSERARELSSMRVLGFTEREISLILLGEQALFCLAALPLGFLLGIGLSALLSLALSSELYRLPLAFSPANFLFAFAVVIIVGALSGLAVWRRMVTLDLIAVLKTRE
ncbi:MAG: FtsX-like permease family protein [Chlorobiaceae bacterium]|nr:FtsX-like permease family protein [Chlorobiaceae bacterium]NTW73798.1 FtsX-like permease family protein [Chlorobiaceae bacterium]